MGHAERLLAEIERRPGSTDADLRVATESRSHQQVNQICRRLAERGHIVRQPRPDGRIGNFPASEAAGFEGKYVGSPRPSVVTDGRGRQRVRPVGSPPDGLPLPAPDSAVVVVPCSKAKVPGGAPGPAPVGLGVRLSDEARRGLAAVRQSNAASSNLDERMLTPAVDRYDGHLYRVAAAALREAALAGQPVLVMSGLYGVVDALEPIGTYERAMHLSDWPTGILERALVDAVRAHERRDAVAFCSRSTDYSAIVKRTPWERAGLRCWLVSPDSSGRGGAQRSVPMATGEAIAAYLGGQLGAGWSSSAGLPVTVEKLA